MKRLSINAITTLIFIIYSVGIVGLLWPISKPYFLLLTPFNLLLTVAILFAYHGAITRPFIYFVIFTATAGFLSEVLGVQRGWLFGEYQYATTLGIKLWDVPLMLGVNWLLLSYCTHCVVRKTTDNQWARAALAATLMVGLDTFIEPVAMRNDFWHWPQGIINSQNYVGWWIVAFLILAIAEYIPFQKTNPLAWPILAAMFYFFGVQCLAYHLGF